ncbi:unnamed protein product, partial [Arctogadus glacialis]
MPTELIHGAGDETVNQPRDPRRPTRTPDIRLNNQRTILGDRTNVGASNSYVPNLDSVKQRIPGANRLSTKNLKRPSRVQTAHGDPQYALLPELTDEDLEGLDDTPVWTSSLLEQIDFTPAQWIDPPATTVGDTISAEP